MSFYDGTPDYEFPEENLNRAFDWAMHNDAPVSHICTEDKVISFGERAVFEQAIETFFNNK